VGYGLSVAPQNRREDEDDMRHASRSSGLLHLETSQTRVSQSSLKTSGGMMQMVHVALSWRSRGDEAKDGQVNAMGCVRLFCLNFAIFVVLGHKGCLIISFSINKTPRVSGKASTQLSLTHPLAIVPFLRGVGVLHGVKEERRESERSLQSSKEWEDVVMISTPCRCLILSIYLIFVRESRLQVIWIIFLFCDF
jgi:hypothetical protein